VAIKIEEGKSYVDRNGDVWGGARSISTTSRLWTLVRRKDHRSGAFAESGRFLTGETSGCDLIFELPETDVVTPGEQDIAERARAIRNRPGSEIGALAARRIATREWLVDAIGAARSVDDLKPVLLKMLEKD